MIILGLVLLAFFLCAGSSWALNSSNPGQLEYPLPEGKRLAVVLKGDPATLHRVFIGFSAPPGLAELGLVRGVGGAIKYTYHLVPAIAAQIPEIAMEKLLQNPRVTSIEPDGRVQAIIDTVPWGVSQIGANTVWNSVPPNTGAGVKVAIIDSGIDYNHQDLVDNYAGGWNFLNQSADPMDDRGHGTHVAGIVAAKQNGLGIVGVAPDASLYALKVLDASGTGVWSDIIAAVQWAVDHGIQVTNNSYADTADTDSSVPTGGVVHTAFDNATAHGLVMIAAAGNNGNIFGIGDNVTYPARFDSVIAVAATDSSNNRASFSSTGPAVELAAPGVNIYSTLPGNSYGTKSGTSMACPHAVGAAALVLASGVSDSNSVRQRLQQTATDLGAAGRDNLYGFGLVNAAKAVTPPPNQPPTVKITSPANGATFATGSTITFAGTASDLEDKDLTAKIVWTSSPGGLLGTGSPISGQLPDGSYTITASVTDSANLEAQASINITVQPQTQPTVKVTSITYKLANRNLNITVNLRDNNGKPVANANVSIGLSRNGTIVSSSTGKTGTTGNVTFTYKNAASGTYTTIVNKVTATGLTWDGTTPTNSFTK